MGPEDVAIHTPYITLDALLKWVGAAATGGEAKTLISGGDVQVNGNTETRRGRKVYPGDRVSVRNAGVWLVTGEGG